MSLIIGSSVVWLRVRWYEVFLIVHIVLALVTLVTLFYHTWIFPYKIYDPFLWPCVAFWVFDRFVRLMRAGITFLGSPQGKATVEYDEAADIVRVDVTKIVDKWRPGGGAHFFVYVVHHLRLRSY